MNIRTIDIKDKQISISVRKSKTAKHIKLQMHPERGIEVVIPYRKSFDIANSIINEHINWIENVHKKSNSLQNKYFYLGREITYDSFPKLYEKIEHEKLFDETKIISEKKYDNFLKKTGKEYLAERINSLANTYGLKFNELRVRKLVSRWGSCTSKKVITLNYKLMKCDAILIDYVIIHELFHLVEMNHSVKFWNLVKKVYPNYKELKLRLRNYYY